MWSRVFVIRATAAVLLVGAALMAMDASAEPARRNESFGDPIGNYNFRVEIGGVDAGHFASVDGLSVEQEVIEYQDGEDLVLRKRPGRVKYGDITLKRGFTESPILRQWAESARLSTAKPFDLKIELVTRKGNVVLRSWNCFECFPKSWKMSTESDGRNDVLTEEMVIVIEWFEEA